MYFNGTKCQLLIFSCFLSASLFAKDVKSLKAEGLPKPLCFIENKGQVLDENNHTRKDVQFKLATKGMSLYVGDGKLHYQFKKVANSTVAPEVSTYGMDVALVGANTHAKVTATDKVDYFENYYLTALGNKGVTANAYHKVVYTNVYPNIDWVIYVNGNNVEYDFVVKPGGEPANIKLAYTGATNLSITADGGILAKTPMGDVAEKHPVAYETQSGKPVDSRFALNDNVVSFVTGKHEGSLTIDPYLSWCTYYGGSNEEEITAVKCISSGGGAIFVTGYTASTDLPTSTGAYQTANGGGTYDAFIAKYNTAGTALLFSTYFGGAGSDMGMAITTDVAGSNIYVTGSTTSTGISTGGAYHSTLGGGTDMFLAKFSTAGARTWVTYIGGSGNETGNAVACDGGGNVYVGGVTSTSVASSIIAGGSPFQTTYGGAASDGYLGKFNGSGTIQWATYYGGGGIDAINGLTVAPSGNLIFTGTTSSTASISSAGAAQVSEAGGTSDAMLGSFATGGSGTRSWATYLGGTGTDEGNGVAVDGAGNIYVVGTTSSTDSIPYGLSYQSTFGGGTYDAFVAQYTSAGARSWGTFLGGNDIDYGYAVNADVYGNIVVTGGTTSTSGFSTQYAYQTASGGSIDAYVAKFNVWGQNIYTTYFGMDGVDLAYGIGTDPTNSSVVIAGYTNSLSGFTTAGVPQTTFGSSAGIYHDGFVAKFLQDTLVAVTQPYTDTLVCKGGTLIVHYTTNINFQPGNTFTVQLSDASGSFASPSNIGTATAVSTGTVSCTIPATAVPGTGYRIRMVSSSPSYVSPDNIYNIHVVSELPAQLVTGTTPVCLGQTIRLFDSVSYPVIGYSWAGPNSFSSVVHNPTIASAVAADAGTYTVTTTHNGCPAVSDTISIAVTTTYPPAPTASAIATLCTNSPLSLSATSGAAGTFSWYWTGPGGFTSTMQNPVVPHVPGPGTEYYSVRDTLNACPSPATTISVVTLPNDTPNIVISVSPNDTVCEATTVHFTSVTTLGGYSPTYQWMSSPTNLITGAVLDYYSTSTFPMGTSIRCILTSSVGCPDKPSDTSNVINMVLLNTTPVVHIFALTDTFISRGGSVSFNSTVAGVSILGGTWYINNVPHADSLGYLNLRNIMGNDTVRYEVASNAACANIGVSNNIVVYVNFAVANVSPALSDVELIPNPNNGAFSIKGSVQGLEDGAADLQVINALGQVVYTGTAAIANSRLSTSVELSGIAPGLYMVHLTKDGEEKTLRFILE